MSWRFGITAANAADVGVLCTLFSEDDLRIERSANSHELVTALIDAGAAPSEAFEAAEPLLQRMNGYARTVDDEQGTCRLAGTWMSPAGETGHILRGTAIPSSARVGLATVAVSGQDPPPVLGPAVIRCADEDLAVADLLYLMANHPRDWFTLYKLYEIIKSEIGDIGITDRGWATGNQLDRFTASANHPGLSKHDARHARAKGSPRSQSFMALDEAAQLAITTTHRFLIERSQHPS